MDRKKDDRAGEGSSGKFHHSEKSMAHKQSAKCVTMIYNFCEHYELS